MAESSVILETSFPLLIFLKKKKKKDKIYKKSVINLRRNRIHSQLVYEKFPFRMFGYKEDIQLDYSDRFSVWPQLVYSYTHVCIINAVLATHSECYNTRVLFSSINKTRHHQNLLAEKSADKKIEGKGIKIRR